MVKSPHILIVDDDREIRDLLSRFLKKHGYRVDAAADGRAMFKALEDARIDLVVLDLMLPGEDGLALCRRLRVTSTLPVITVMRPSFAICSRLGGATPSPASPCCWQPTAPDVLISNPAPAAPRNSRRSSSNW